MDMQPVTTGSEQTVLCIQGSHKAVIHRVNKLCWTHPEELGLQQTLQHLVAAFPLGLFLQDAFQEDPDLSDLSVCWEQIDGLQKKQQKKHTHTQIKPTGLLNSVDLTLLVFRNRSRLFHYQRERCGSDGGHFSSQRQINFESVIYENKHPLWQRS